MGPVNMADYMNLRLRHVDSTDLGGCSYIAHVAHAAEAIVAGRCEVALITLAGRPRSEGHSGTNARPAAGAAPDLPWEGAVPPDHAQRVWHVRGPPYAPVRHHIGAIGLDQGRGQPSRAIQPERHAADVVTVEDVVSSPMISDPLHRLDCCIVSDGGGALVVTSPSVARGLKRPLVKVLGGAETVKGQMGGALDLTYSGAIWTGPAAFEMAGVTPGDIQYASIYDSFTITVLMQIEDLGFCPKGEGGKFVADGNLISGVGKLPWNTDGGGLCNNHPANRGGITKVI